MQTIHTALTEPAAERTQARARDAADGANQTAAASASAASLLASLRPTPSFHPRPANPSTLWRASSPLEPVSETIVSCSFHDTSDNL